MASPQRAVQVGHSDQEIRKCFSAYPTEARHSLGSMCPRILAKLGSPWS